MRSLAIRLIIIIIIIVSAASYFKYFKLWIKVSSIFYLHNP